MKNGIMKRALSTVVAGFLAITSSPFAAKTSIEADAAKVLTTSPGHTQETGWYNDYHHEIWQADTPNSSTMTLADDGGGFSTSWKCGPNGSRGNFLARRGLFYGRNTGKHWQDHGNFTCDFDCEWSAGSAGNSRICIYGWTENPLVEFYIIEDWKNWVPSSSSAKQITVDGSVYDVFTNQMNSYNITNSNGPFTQYISVRKTPRTSGRISIYKHFEAWESLGMKMGDFYEVAFNVEGWESDGQANVKKNIIKTNGGGEETTTSEPATAPEPDKDGNYLAEGFESGKGSFTGRGDATVSVDTENYYDGKSSLKISGRTKNWHGGAIKLDSSTFVPGNTYSISAAALQKSGSTKDLKLTLEYTAGDQDWKEVASADAKSGEWTKLENTEFTIPSGASDMTLYIESSDETLDIFLDSVQIAKKGKSSNVKTGGGTVGGSTTSTITTNTTSSYSEKINYDDAQLKYVFGKYFKFGTCVSQNEVGKSPDFIRKHFNSITPENELKPDQILDQNASKSMGNNVNPQVRLGYGAKKILDFAAKYNIPVRGHTLIWHSQTPAWLFKENFDDNGATVSKETMNKRIDNFIKNTFDLLKKEYPTVKFYAYDVANECFDDQNGGLRSAGWNQRDGQSPWTLIYGDDSFLEVAFTSAKKYAPADCKLFYNDYNEYYNPKHKNIVNLCQKLYSKGLLDGVGMQSHLGTSQPDLNTYKQALADFQAIGCEIQVTELDITKDNGASDDAQASVYKNIVSAIMNTKNVTSLTVWGTNDSASWRSPQSPLLFNGSYQPKAAFNSIVSLVNKSDWSTGETEQPTTQERTTEEPTTEAPTSSSKVTKYGDANCDKIINIADAVLVMQVATNPDKYAKGKTSYSISEIGEANADVDGKAGLTNQDALLIQKFKLGLITEFPAQKKTNVTTTKQTTTEPTTINDVPANYFKSSFNSSSDSWKGRGDASVAVNKDNYISGSSLKVTGRSKNWNGAEIALDSSFVAGGTYSISAGVLQRVSESDNFKISLEYTASNGEKDYNTIAEGKASKDTWTKLENTAYTVPDGATDLIMYIETAETTIDFYIDEVAVQAKGTKSSITTGSGTVSKEEEITTGKVDPSKPMIAISFDDGCSPANNKKIVDALTEQGFHATFFYVKNWSQGADNQAEIKYAYSKGMEIANHSTTHPYLGQKSSYEVRQEVDGCHDYLKSIIGAEPSKLLRLPYLDQGGAVKSTLTDYGLVTCAIDTEDWKDETSTSQIVQTIKNAMSNGSGNGAVVLCHETKDKTVAAIQELAPYIKAQGWQIVTISEMYAAKGKSIPYGQIITRV